MFSNSKYAKKKWDILSAKRESGMVLKKREFTPESGNVDTYVVRYSGARVRYPLFRRSRLPNKAVNYSCRALHLNAAHYIVTPNLTVTN